MSLPRLMRQFAPLAASSSKRPLRSLNLRNPPFHRDPKHPQSPPLHLQRKRMPPDTPAEPSQTHAATRLRHARCLFHPLREAAARCPHCGGTFCRECVTDEEGKLACPPCLRRLARPAAPKPSLARLFREVLTGLT